MANLNRRWRRGIAVGCNHANLACKVAQDNVIAYSEERKFDVRLDLGDVGEYTSFRRGAGAQDSAVGLEEDREAQQNWLRRFRPTHRVRGNHDHRIYTLGSHPSAQVRFAAHTLINEMQALDEELGTKVKPYHQRDGWFEFGGYKWGHGWRHGQNALLKHANNFGSCVIAHLHKVGMVVGTRLDELAICYCVGMMGDPDKFEYAVNAESWLSWCHGAAEFEFCDDDIAIWLHVQKCNHGQEEPWHTMRSGPLVRP
jgi:hypothetical protein